MIRFVSGRAVSALAAPTLAMIVAFGAADVRAQSAASNAAAIDALSKKVMSMGAGGMGGVAKGVDGVSLKISGQISRSVLYIQDGIYGGRSAITYVDNDHIPTYVRWDANTQINSRWKLGGVLEMEMQSNSSFLASPVRRNSDGTSDNIDSDTFSAHHGLSYVWINGPFGMLRTGQMETVLDHLINTGFHYAEAADIEPHHGGELSLASFTVGSSNDSSYRNDGIRYDTPIWRGFQLGFQSTYTGAIGMAARYSGQLAGVGVRAALGYRETTSPGNFRKTVIAPDPQTRQDVPQVFADVIPDHHVLQGAGGLNLGRFAVNAGFTVFRMKDTPKRVIDDQMYYYLSLTHRGNYVNMGPTSIGVDFERLNGGDTQDFGNRFAAAPSNVIHRSSVALGVVQQLTPGVDAFASFRYLFSPRNSPAVSRDARGNVTREPFASAKSAQLGLMGMRVKF